MYSDQEQLQKIRDLIRETDDRIARQQRRYERSAIRGEPFHDAKILLDAMIAERDLMVTQLASCEAATDAPHRNHVAA